MVSVEEIKAYNSRLAASKQKLHSLEVELEIRQKEAALIMEQLSAELGVQVTEENAQELFEKYQADLEVQLANGNSILDRLNAGMNGNAPVNNNIATMNQSQPVNMYGQQPPISTMPSYNNGTLTI